MLIMFDLKHFGYYNRRYLEQMNPYYYLNKAIIIKHIN